MYERILLAERDDGNRLRFHRCLTENHYRVESASTENDVFRHLERYTPDLLILDTALSKQGESSLCGTIRAQSAVPIILTSQTASTEEKVRGFENGADDFLQKPCDLRELCARAKAVMRRDHAEKDEKERERENKHLTFDRFDLSLEKYELKLDGSPASLTPKELQLLYFLASNPNRVYTRDQLLDRVWGYNYLGNTRTIDAHIRKVREKCNGVSDKWCIRTVWGVGYKFELAG